MISVFGLVSFFKPSAERRDLVAKKTVERPQNLTAEKPAVNAVAVQPQQQIDNRAPAANSMEGHPPRTLAAMPIAKVPVETSEPVYICGAATKKGTPCSRKVKGLVRCWQHLGQPAMLPPDQLRVSR